MKISAIIPVKTFANAKTRLNLGEEKKIEFCKMMLEEVLKTLSVSNVIDSVVVVSKDEEALKLAKKFDVSIETKVESVESFSDFLVQYIDENHVDLLIIDSHSLDKAEHDDHKETINKIYEEISCPLLTLK